MEGLIGVHEQVRAFFCEQLHVDPPADDADLLEGGLLDSLFFVSLLVHLEQSFGVKVDLEKVDIEAFKSIARIAEFVASTNGRREG